MSNVLLLTALVLPVLLFWQFRSRFRLSGLVAAAVSIAVGWVLNFAWASTANESTAIAARFGWICPTVFVGLTWVFLRYKNQRVA